MDLRDKKALVVGLGKSGASAARYLLARGARVKATDVKPEETIGDARDLREMGVIVEAGGHRTESFLSSDLIVLSPGVPPDIDPLHRARVRGVPIISEIELAASELREPIVGITGTNGKSTATALLGDVFAEAGIEAFVGGNIGTPLTEYAGGARFVVLELSSFQLEAVSRFRPFIAVMLNVSDDHLDRYPDLAAYRAAKERIFLNQQRSDYAILNLDDPHVREMKKNTKARVYWFSASQRPRRGMYLDREARQIRNGPTGEEVLSLAGLKSPAVMPENVMAAALAAQLCGVDRESIRRAVSKFRGLPHRCEWVGEIDGVDYYDDSKGTNVGAVVRALQSFDPPIILIAGGRDKGGEYAPLRALVREKVRGVVLIGEARDKIARALEGTTEIALAGSMDEAVAIARRMARRTDRVLLSPACSSFDMFSNYAERGYAFQEAVRRLAGGSDPLPAGGGIPGPTVRAGDGVRHG